jgi:hypothetical protein
MAPTNPLTGLTSTPPGDAWLQDPFSIAEAVNRNEKRQIQPILPIPSLLKMHRDDYAEFDEYWGRKVPRFARIIGSC